MNKEEKGKYIAALGAFLVHLVLIILLVLLGISVPVPTEESGVPVMLGEMADAQGEFDPSTLVDVDIMPEEAAAPSKPAESADVPDLITQANEQTVAVERKTESKKKEVKRTEKTAAEKAAEARKLAEAEAERERKAAAELASKRVAGAFGKGVGMGSRGTTSGEGTQGSKSGNSSTGALTGTGGYGTFDLGGRSIGTGGLPRPQYNVQDDGKVSVNITVNPAGVVINTSINLNKNMTNTINPVLRKAAEDAAKKARFNAVDGVNNQTGTITYYFNLR
ncbi:MAG: TonB family protein [Bacteroides graminisolvens]|nr:TonB family protein [Bacteroides graminisolvens]